VKIRLVAVGKIRERYVAAAADDFRTRLRPYHVYEEIEVAPSRGTDSQRAMREEASRVLTSVSSGDVLWLLERSGTQLSSRELAERVQGLERSSAPRLVLAVAGTHGAGTELIARADFQWSLSRLTFLHEWARMLVLEQLYRAAKIAHDEPYHR
jgi:23S rRNA (pseudouridine1915-N3)-methyltransferase